MAACQTLLDNQTYPLHLPLHGLRRGLDRLAKLLKVMVGPWGLEPQTSTVSRLDQQYTPTLVDPDSFLFTMRCRRIA